MRFADIDLAEITQTDGLVEGLRQLPVREFLGDGLLLASAPGSGTLLDLVVPGLTQCGILLQRHPNNAERSVRPACAPNRYVIAVGSDFRTRNTIHHGHHVHCSVHGKHVRRKHNIPSSIDMDQFWRSLELRLGRRNPLVAANTTCAKGCRA